MATNQAGKKKSRREFVKKAAYIVPAIASLKAAPAFAKAGSDKVPKPPKEPKPPKPPKPPKRP